MMLNKSDKLTAIMLIFFLGLFVNSQFMALEDVQ